MIALLAAVTLSPQAGAAAPSAGPLISKMLDRYSKAKTASGRISFVQQADGASVTVDTELQYERPNKLYIRQERKGSDAHVWLAVSDGKVLSYDRPEGVFGRDRFRDKVGPSSNLSDLYTAVLDSLGERSPALAMMISRRDDLVALLQMWGPTTIAGKTTLRGTEAFVIDGSYRVASGGRLSGKLEMVITADGDLLRYVQREKVQLPAPSNKLVELVTTWDCNVRVDAPVDDGLFTVK